jgi:hypothetical protein
MALVAGVGLAGCGDAEAPRWLRGNTHAHTELCGHADASPAQVAAWYRDAGYDFLVLSEHDQLIEPDEVRAELEASGGESILLIRGQEIGGLRIHVTGLGWGPQQSPEPLPDLRDRSLAEYLAERARRSKTQALQEIVDRVLRHGALPILNHPNYQYALTASDVRGVTSLGLLELFNGHINTNTFGDRQHADVESLWDALLSDGMRIYGVASDDAHHFESFARDRRHANPGRGWVMVRGDRADPEQILAALARGDFYASSGIVLEDVVIDDEQYRVHVDAARTRASLASPLRLGRELAAGEPLRDDFRIEFIGPLGARLARFDGVTSAAYPLRGAGGYVRARVSARRQIGDQVREFYAWAQPRFMDESRGGNVTE